MRSHRRRSLIPALDSLASRLLLSDGGGVIVPPEQPPADASTTDLAVDASPDEASHGYIRIKKLNSGG